MAQPVTTPCAHNFCKSCLEEAFSGRSFVRERSGGGRALRLQKNIMKCPCCTNDISDFLKGPQVNRELMEVIESLKQKAEQDDEPVEESNDEETDALEAISDSVLESSKSRGKHHEEASVTGGSDFPPALERENKRTKVDFEGFLGSNNDGKEAAFVAEKPDGLYVDSEAGKVPAGNDGRDEEATEEANNTEASPLLMPSVGQDST